MIKRTIRELMRRSRRVIVTALKTGIANTREAIHRSRQVIVIILKTSIVSILLLTLFLLLSLIIPLITGQNLGISEFGNLYLQKVSKPLIVFHIYEIEKSSNSIGFELDHIVLPPNICVDGMTLLGAYSGYELPYRVSPSFGGSSSGWGAGDIGGYDVYGCSRSEQIRLNGYNLLRNKNNSEGLKQKLIISEQSIYYFPFDERSVTIFPAITLYENNGEKQRIIDYEIAGWVTAPKSDEKILLKNIDGKEPYIEVYFYRPIAYRALTLILLGSLFLLITSLFFIADNGTFLEVSVGILFGLWGIQDILIPKNITETTMVNSLILTLYVCFIFVFLLRFVRFNVWRWLNRFYRGD
ncbi:hypothetical protein NDI45_24375 [Leptolyngbya sp. GB1-A1]|uniref:hypothetical protein n=1 Tax=Leptolyngbya sp. GB1-A1 TaxID=2933908 RepID=UPI003299CAE9